MALRSATNFYLCFIPTDSTRWLWRQVRFSSLTWHFQASKKVRLVARRTALLVWTGMCLCTSVAIWSCFHEKIFEWQLFEKKCAKKSFFSACEKGAFFSVSVYFGKMLNFAGLWCLNHVTHRDSWGIIGKIISVAFIWYLVGLCVTASLVTIASLKSGLILSSLKMLISVLSNKAVLGLP